MPAPQQLGSYVIDAEIGRGGMGVVYRARDPRLDRWVAIKTLPPELIDDAAFLARFEREARILASLHHPGIAGIHAIDHADGVRFLALEYVEGPTLAERLAQRPLPVAEAIEIARQLAAAIEAAHETGVIHRDLKPGNIKLTPNGEVKVLDFGLARFEGPPQGDHVRSLNSTLSGTQVGVILGTLGYMSPEQARGKTLDRRTDIWSFGCVLYECLTGRRAFAGETPSDSIVRILEYEPDLSILPPDTPPAVVELLQRCLVKDPRQRLRDMGDARVVLEQVLATRSPSGRFPMAAVRPGSKASRPKASIALVALCFVAGGALGMLGAQRLLHPAAALRSVAVPMPGGYAIRSSLVTPDGNTVVVSATPRGASDAEGSAPRVFLRPIDAREFRLLPQSMGVQSAALTADGRSFLMALPVPGTAQRRLVRAPLDGSAPPTPLADWADGWNTMTALPGGDVLVMDGPKRLVRISATGGTPSSPLDLQISGSVKVSQVELLQSRLPDGEPFVNVIAYDARGWHYNVGILEPKTGHVTIVVEDGGNAWYWGRSDLLFFARGRSIFAARFDRARHRLRGAPVAVWTGLRATTARPGYYRVLDDGTLYQAPGGTDDGRTLAIAETSGALTPRSDERRAIDDTPVLAPDGHRFACTVANGRGIDELWIGDISHPGFTHLGTDPDADCSQPVWSPDGTHIAYKRQAQDARDGVYVMDLASGATRRILKPESGQAMYRPQTWGAAGVIATREAQGKVALLRIPTTGAEVSAAEARPLHASQANENSPRLSPDGRTLAYTSDGSGRWELYLAPLAGDGSLGAALQVTSSGAVACTWATDGRSVYAVDLQGRIVEFPVPATAGAPIPRFDLRQLNLASVTPLPGRRFLACIASEDERDIAYYWLVQGWIGEVERILRKSN